MVDGPLTVGDIAKRLEQWYPLRLAEDWDNVGLLVGRRSRPVTRVLVCLTVTPEVVDEAVAGGYELIVSHHPVLFRPTQRLTEDDPMGCIAYRLARHDIAVYSPHTAFDSAREGINQMLAEAIGLTGVRALRPAQQPAACKIVVFVPESDLDRVLDAMFGQGAGIIGEYLECSFRVAGKGTFFGTDATSPTVGQKGRREQVDEWRVEVVCPAERVAAVVTAMKAAHSYEEPAYDVYPLVQLEDASVGGGRFGTLTEPEPLGQFARRFGGLVGARVVQVVGDESATIRSVAIACGAGASFLGDAAAAGADVLVTGEARFHQQLEARQRGIALVLLGHYEMERFGVERLTARLQEAFAGLSVKAADETSPVLFLTTGLSE